MNRYKVISTFFLLVLCQAAQSQAYKTLNIKTFPDSAEVYVNNELQGYTPIKFSHQYNFRDFAFFEIRISKTGYVSKIYTVNNTKEVYRLSSSIEEILEKKRPTFDTINTLIEMDKVIFEVEEGKKIGEVRRGSKKDDLVWQKSFAVETEDFNKITREELAKAGFNMKNPLKLFAEDVVEKEAPLLVGANLKSVQVNYEVGSVFLTANNQYQYSAKNTLCTVELEWQIFSRKKRSVIYKTISQGNAFAFESRDIETLISKAVRDAVIVLGQDSALRNAVKNYENVMPKTETGKKKTELESVKSEAFADFASMVQKRITSSVTVIRDDQGHGSGFLISGNGYLVTNYHVVDKTKELTIKFENGFEFPADVVTYDEDYDVALLKIKGNGFKGMPVNPAMAGVGTEVTAIGTPAKIDLGQTVTKGIISGKREVESKIYYQTDVSVSPGNSGGPLLNSKGEVIGIITWGIRGAGTEGLNFAIPISVALEKLGIAFTEMTQKPTAPTPPVKK